MDNQFPADKTSTIARRMTEIIHIHFQVQVLTVCGEIRSFFPPHA